MPKLHWWRILALFSVLWWGGHGMVHASSSAAATATATAVGYVKTTAGDVWITTQGQVVKAALGTAIFQGSRLKTGANSSLGIAFIDNTVISFGAETESVVDEYLYAPNQSQFGLGMNLVKGTLNYMSGLIAKLKPESVTIKTPTGIIGVRGTRFVARVEE